ncbi:MAG: hypothetical protein ACTSO7_08085 [Candidatus Heimdallarchaeota archaeon]
MSAKEIFSQIVRYLLFFISIAGEFTLAVFFLVFKFYTYGSTVKAYYGYTLTFGWEIAIASLLIGIGLFVFLLYAYILPDDKKKGIFSETKNVRNLGLLTVFAVFVQIILVGVAILYYTPLALDVGYAYIIIILLSCVPPFVLYYAANFDPESEKLFSLSKATPLRIKLTTIWLLFLTGVMQILSIDWTFLVVSLFSLLAAYFLYFLTRYAIALTPIVLIIHTAFSILMAVVAYLDLNALITAIGLPNIELQAILFPIFILIIPAVISLLLAQSLFRKWLLEWAREIQPAEEMEIERYYEEDGDDYEDKEELEEEELEDDEE